MSTNW